MNPDKPTRQGCAKLVCKNKHVFARHLSHCFNKCVCTNIICTKTNHLARHVHVAKKGGCANEVAKEVVQHFLTTRTHCPCINLSKRNKQCHNNNNATLNPPSNYSRCKMLTDVHVFIKFVGCWDCVSLGAFSDWCNKERGILIADANSDTTWQHPWWRQRNVTKRIDNKNLCVWLRLRLSTAIRIGFRLGLGKTFQSRSRLACSCSKTNNNVYGSILLVQFRFTSALNNETKDAAGAQHLSSHHHAWVEQQLLAAYLESIIFLNRWKRWTWHRTCWHWENDGTHNKTDRNGNQFRLKPFHVPGKHLTIIYIFPSGNS